LIIAADLYEDQGLANLRSPSQDAQALASVLADRSIGGYQVLAPILNKPSDVAREAIEAFFTEAKFTDVLLLYLSCHGVKDEAGQLCFAMTTTKMGRLASTSITSEFLAGQVRRCPSRHIVILLDCCYSGAFPKGLQARSGDRVSVAPLGQTEPQGRGCVVITACTATENAFEKGADGGWKTRTLSKAQPSLFTGALVEGLRTGAADRNKDGRIDADELYDHIYEQVRTRTPFQTPEKSGSTRGTLIVGWNPRAGTPPTPPTPAPPPWWHRHLPIAVALALIFGGAGVGIPLALDSNPLTVNTCARLSSAPMQPTQIGSMTVGRPGADKDYTGATIAPGCQVLAIGGNGVVQVWNMVTGHELAVLRADPNSDAFATKFTPDGNMLVVPSLNGYTTLWNVNNGQRVGILDSDPATSATIAGTWGTALSPDGSRLYTGGANNVIREWNLATRQSMSLANVPDGIGSLALSPDGKTLAIGGGKGTEYLFDASTGRQIEGLPGGSAGNAFAVTFSPNGKMLAVATDFHGLQLWDLTTRTLLLGASQGSATSVAFSPDGTIVAAGYANTVGLWNVSTGKEIASLPLGTGSDFATAVTFSRYGAVLAVAYNGQMQFWNIAGVARIPQ
jgi:hypothetical protein